MKAEEFFKEGWLRNKEVIDDIIIYFAPINGKEEAGCLELSPKDFYNIMEAYHKQAIEALSDQTIEKLIPDKGHNDFWSKIERTGVKFAKEYYLKQLSK